MTLGCVGTVVLGSGSGCAELGCPLVPEIPQVPYRGSAVGSTGEKETAEGGRDPS